MGGRNSLNHDLPVHVTSGPISTVDTPEALSNGRVPSKGLRSLVCCCFGSLFQLVFWGSRTRATNLACRGSSFVVGGTSGFAVDAFLNPPKLPQDEWEKWNSFFDRVDQDEDGSWVRYSTRV